MAAGADVTVIRSWLGHVSLNTTNHYAQANLDTKRAALELLDHSSKQLKNLRGGSVTNACSPGSIRSDRCHK
ncbi:hypothetical protein RGU70_13425 [Herbaspirillum sp. RTI4]|uniref:hypothetical protein n=1 Tax=Herbaspirillum sp. RTI4 TaxID=3048640 RepID=UPI002AB52556|nr:hypothetical protein [Herbaspirillum sp. RTI4]MDY7579315.1 hypothetical protein [Herbaspirillum sp. RTI4]MEA9980229.1 hypothetical protein [Herbaspirillum sp. RTI4]